MGGEIALRHIDGAFAHHFEHRERQYRCPLRSAAYRATIVNYVTNASLIVRVEDGETIGGDCHTSYLTLICLSAARSQTCERISHGPQRNPRLSDPRLLRIAQRAFGFRTCRSHVETAFGSDEPTIKRFDIEAPIASYLESR